jgi:hypothetical protein
MAHTLGGVSDSRAMPSDGPDDEQSAGARPAGPATEIEGPEVVSDSRPWQVLGIVLLVVFLAILVYAVVLPATR